jgi:hypothetical protein
MKNNKPKTFLLPSWFPKFFPHSQWYIHSTAKNEEDRTPFIMYLVIDRKVTVMKGTVLDSKNDYKAMVKLDKSMAKIKKESDRKQAQSWLDAKNLVLD